MPSIKQVSKYDHPISPQVQWQTMRGGRDIQGKCEGQHLGKQKLTIYQVKTNLQFSTSNVVKYSIFDIEALVYWYTYQLTADQTVTVTVVGLTVQIDVLGPNARDEAP